MTFLRAWLARFGGLFRGASRDQALSDEIQAHLDHLADDLMERGMSRTEALAAAHRAFGGVDQIKEAYRDQRGWPPVEQFAGDLRLALRLVAARPGAAALAVISLALGIGVSMAFFTLFNAICLRGLPIDRPDRVLFLTSRDAEAKPSGLSYADFRDLQSSAQSFVGLAAYAPALFNAADDRDPPERIAGSYISSEAFRVLGVSPAIGREFTPADELPGAPSVAVIGHAVWLARYGGDPTVVGRALRLNGRPATVVGVMPDGFRFPAQANLWLPIIEMPGLKTQPRSIRGLAVFGRLTDASSLLSAGDELQALAGHFETQYPATNRGIRFLTVPIDERFNGKVTDPGWLAFLTAALLVLLVACANVASLLLARLGARSREVALRVALGATRRRILRQFLCESVVLAGLAGVVGLGFAIAAVRLLAWSVPSAAPLPYWISFTVDDHVLAALVVTCMAGVILVGIVPAVHGSRIDANELLRDGGRQGTGGRRGRLWNATFLAVEFALTFVLLANVSMQLLTKDPGLPIDPAPLLTAGVTLPSASYATSDDRRRFYERLDVTVGRLDGVVSMTTTRQLPPDPGQPGQLVLAGQTLGPGEEGQHISVASVGLRYFETLGVGMVAGRDLTTADDAAGHEAVVVNRRFADKFFAGQMAIGQRIQIVGEAAKTAPVWRTIVGVAPDLRQGPRPMPMAYVSDRETAPATTMLLVRAAVRPDVLAPIVQSTVATLDQDLPLYRVAPLAVARHEQSWNGRVSSDIIHTISMIALLLAVVGLYAATAFAVVQRTYEIGIRVALGARPRAVTWLVLRRALSYVVVGLAAGLPCTVPVRATVHRYDDEPSPDRSGEPRAGWRTHSRGDGCSLLAPRRAGRPYRTGDRSTAGVRRLSSRAGRRPRARTASPNEQHHARRPPVTGHGPARVGRRPSNPAGAGHARAADPARHRRRPARCPRELLQPDRRSRARDLHAVPGIALGRWRHG